MDKNKNQICQRCICDTTIPGITFDEQGICNFCKVHQVMEKRYPRGRAGQKLLKKIIQRIRKAGRGKKHDCIVGVSGGRDSTYLLYLTVKLGLRPLAVHFDNGWDSEIAVSNIHNALAHLKKVDLETYVVDWEEFKDLQKSFLKASVSDAEIPTDVGIFGILHRVAEKEKIHFILNGHSFRTEGLMPLGWTYMDGRYIKNVQKIFGSKSLKTFPNFSLWDFVRFTFIDRIETIALLNYVDYNQKEVEKILKKELGWRYYGGHHHESYYTNFFQSFLLPRKFGIDKRKIEYSALIRSGQMDRGKALREVHKTSYPYDEQLIAYILNKINLKHDEFQTILAQPIKTFQDYPTYYSLIKFFQWPLWLATKIGFISPLLYPKFFSSRQIKKVHPPAAPRILVDINHPAHVHFFKNFIWEMQRRGWPILVTASRKEMAQDLLSRYRIPYKDMGSYGKSIINKMFNIPVMAWRLFRIARKFKPDIFLGLGSQWAAQTAWFLRKPCYLFDDTLYKPNVKLYLPFVTKVFTPDCVTVDLGPKQVRYAGYHQLASLHPKYFEPNPNILGKYNLKPSDRFFIIRFVGWRAGHDFLAHGLSHNGKITLIKKLSQFGRSIITSEEPLPAELESYRLRVAPDKIHHLIYYADLVISEGGTMASEAVVLGTPTIFMSTLEADTLREQCQKYGLVMIHDENTLWPVLDKLLVAKDLKKKTRVFRRRILQDKVNVTELLINLVDLNV